MPQFSSPFLVLIVVCAVMGQNTTDQFQSANVKINNFSTAASTTTSDNSPTSTDLTVLTTTESNTYSSTSTRSKGCNSTTQGKISQTAASPEPTRMSPPSPLLTPPPTTHASGSNEKPGIDTNGGEKSTTVSPTGAGDDRTGIIVLIILILLVFVLGAVFLFARGRGRHYSVDLTSRPDEVNVPLSPVEAALPADSDPEKGLQALQSTDNPAKEAEVKPEAQEEQKVEANKPDVDPSAEAAAPAVSSSDDKPKEDVVENNSATPVEASAEDKTDDESVTSDKTSVESLKETNENSSNNVGLCHKGEERSSTDTLLCQKGL